MQWQKPSTQVLNLQPNNLDQLPPPAGIILPPPDTALSIDSTINAQQNKINALSKIDFIKKSFVNEFTTQSPFPTLISWNSNVDSYENLHLNKIKNQTTSLTKISKFGIKDGETQTNLRNNNIRKGSLNPPYIVNENKNIEALEQLQPKSSQEETLSQEAFKPKQIIDTNYNKNNTVLIEHLPPVPKNSETIWLPVNFYIKPSLLNTSNVERTTFSPHNNNERTTQLLNSKNVKQNSQLTEILEEIDNKIKDEKNLENLNTIILANVTQKSQISFLFKRRGDLPIPFDENAGSKVDNIQTYENKIWTNENFGKILLPPVQIHNQNKTTNSHGLFGNSNLFNFYKK